MVFVVVRGGGGDDDGGDDDDDDEDDDDDDDDCSDKDSIVGCEDLLIEIKIPSLKKHQLPCNKLYYVHWRPRHTVLNIAVHAWNATPKDNHHTIDRSETNKQLNENN